MTMLAVTLNDVAVYGGLLATVVAVVVAVVGGVRIWRGRNRLEIKPLVEYNSDGHLVVGLHAVKIGPSKIEILYCEIEVHDTATLPRRFGDRVFLSQGESYKAFHRVTPINPKDIVRVCVVDNRHHRWPLSKRHLRKLRSRSSPIPVPDQVDTAAGVVLAKTETTQNRRR